MLLRLRNYLFISANAATILRGRTTKAKPLPVTPIKEFPLFVAVQPRSLAFIQGRDLSITLTFDFIVIIKCYVYVMHLV